MFYYTMCYNFGVWMILEVIYGVLGNSYFPPNSDSGRNFYLASLVVMGVVDPNTKYPPFGPSFCCS